MLLPPPQVRRYTPRKTGSANDVLHKVIREHLGELISMTEERGRPLRHYVLHELAGYLACGRPEAGFTWYECPDCKHALVLPFSCQGRGFCPSCGGRRMNQIAANLVDHVLPHVPHRQWVLTLLRMACCYAAPMPV